MTTPADIISNVIDSRINSIHTANIGIIKSYDASTNRSTIQPALNIKYLTQPEPIPLPVIENVPIIFPWSSSFSMTFPVREGDYCLLVFIERSIDLWKAVGGQVTPDDPRKYNLSDCVAIPGLLPFNTEIPENDNESFLIKIGESRFRIASDGTICFHNTSNELIQSINDIVTAIQGLLIVVAGTAGTVDPTYNTSVLQPLLAKLNTFVGDC